MLELEVTAGILVITVAGIVGSVSPPGEPGTQQLTAAQTRALLSPHPPRTAFANHALPVIMIFGSLLLLGHAHATLDTSDELTNLINVQHAVFGAFGLFAGTVRWLSLRGLVPPRAAGWLWPSLIVALGLFMTFCYRELTLAW